MSAINQIKKLKELIKLGADVNIIARLTHIELAINDENKLVEQFRNEMLKGNGYSGKAQAIWEEYEKLKN